METHGPTQSDYATIGQTRENCAFVDHRGNELRCSSAVYQEIRWLREIAASAADTYLENRLRYVEKRLRDEGGMTTTHSLEG